MMTEIVERKLSSDQQRQYRAAQSEVHQISCQAVCHALNGRSGLLRLLHRFDDPSKSRIAAEIFDGNFQSAGLVESPREDPAPWKLVLRHRFASDGSLLYSRIS